MKTFIGVQPVHHFLAAVFQIPTIRGDVFMYEVRTNYMNDERAIVEVDAEKFLELWRTPFSSYHKIALGTPATWPSDYKYHLSEEHFVQGRKNPVPLAQVSCCIDTVERPVGLAWRLGLTALCQTEKVNVPSLHFTDGITRTIWLLTNGASQFPVQCSTKEAPLMQKLVGAVGTRFCTVDDLIPAACA